jgi:hypothetical protein
MRPQQDFWTEPCRHRYHEQQGDGMVDLAVCSCGTFAIGRCLDCDRPVCGDCSSVYGGRRLCGNCLRVVQQREGAERSAEQARQATRNAEAAARRAAEAASAERAHAEKVRAREGGPGVPTPAALASRRRELERLVGRFRGASGPSAGGFWGAAVGWFVGITVAYFVITSAARGQDGVPGAVFATTYVGIGVVALLIWLGPHALRSMRSARWPEWEKELAELKFQRGCGERSCRRCYAGQ